ncbi:MULTISPECIES: hypothetical protein [Bacillus]|uniref:hypothetical protein n=1 Tax=Bacillus TaxID=1386 RepID=UPI0027425366|nr:hypothetical protein [Bacillus stercoris]MEC2060619.1 hypothetical protein [Bacillus stercoris]WIL34319.1 hypothetical protein QPZ67_12215 [Bacillus stercoris]
MQNCREREAQRHTFIKADESALSLLLFVSGNCGGRLAPDAALTANRPFVANKMFGVFR